MSAVSGSETEHVVVSPGVRPPLAVPRRLLRMRSDVALAERFVPWSDHHGHYHLGWCVVMGVILVFALVASVYLVYVLEIFKFKSLRTIQLRRVDPDTSEHDIVASVERDIETGEFEAIEPDDTEPGDPGAES